MKNDRFTFKSAGQIHELELAMDAAGGWDWELVKKLSNKNILAQARDVLKGISAITPIPHIIDCDADPFILKDWKVEEHQKGGMWQWDINKIFLYRSQLQKKGQSTNGNDLRKELENKPVLNANVLDYLLKHPELVPKEWEDKLIFFWGTVYSDTNGTLGIRYLFWNGVRWSSYYYWLDGYWNSSSSAIFRVS